MCCCLQICTDTDLLKLYFIDIYCIFTPSATTYLCVISLLSRLFADTWLINEFHVVMRLLSRVSTEYASFSINFLSGFGTKLVKSHQRPLFFNSWRVFRFFFVAHCANGRWVVSRNDARQSTVNGNHGIPTDSTYQRMLPFSFLFSCLFQHLHASFYGCLVAESFFF